MSVFLVSSEHINVMIYAGIASIDPMVWVTDDEPSPTNGVSRYGTRELNRSTATVVGQMLIDANAASVNARYSEENSYTYEYESPKYVSWSLVEVLAAIDCFEYQACEVEDYYNTEAPAFCRALRNNLISRLSGYEEAPWGIEPESTPTNLHT